ncbi:peroxin PEX13 KNAG_0B02520 [Huiozyma naganishii CBS 8797]|uniref:Peroxisomal membrane protein PEX13 n=1 Tax=Huiozyma naganishii (strain ATCC MYA-139 / BCRC 22969 / CBS 8797 / KCTC 17520 / NBRC 10181 / NCYC 3082 / Yp74L-3) TaxID=1071383 RepID=J7S3F5_HUIN7|nr:hypothetical protein KNAG_0B02520 [Kazachstania naganishii CBS 8797]CCK68694.1 hypothetical protein KNAG_0B02520 [Kazachstania naganishii CBS 8797]
MNGASNGFGIGGGGVYNSPFNTYGSSGPYGMNAGGYGMNGGGYGMGGVGYGYGGLSGGYGGGMGVYNRYGIPGGGGVAGNGDTNFVTESTMATFQLLENLIGAINGFAQMLESSYMATHNSFFTLISFAEEIGRLKEMLGSFFGLFGIIKFLKRLLRFRSARRARQGGQADMVDEFTSFASGATPASRKRARRRLAWKPLIIFFMGVFGFPYLLNKYINRLNEKHANQILSKGLDDDPVDLTKLKFARALYDFVPENAKIEVPLKKGDLMAIISEKDTFGRDSQWWRVRTRDGNVGYIPYNYVEVIKRRQSITN